MKKLAIVVLLVVAGCRRQVVVTNAPPTGPQPAPSSASLNTPGGATHRDALNRFMAAAKAQDLQAVSNVWGTKDGPARNGKFMTVEQMEQRIVIMLRCLRHDSFAVKAETPASGGGRVFNVEVRLGNTIALADFATVPGPANRFYVNTVDLEKLAPICGAK